jgi:hypothetical protein
MHVACLIAGEFLHDSGPEHYHENTL